MSNTLTAIAAANPCTRSLGYQMAIKRLSKCHRLAVHFRLCQNQFHEICGLAILPLNGDVFLASATQWQTEGDCGYSLATMSAMR